MGILNYLTHPNRPWISASDYPDHRSESERDKTASETLRELKHQLKVVDAQLENNAHQRQQLARQLVELQEQYEKLKAAGEQLCDNLNDITTRMEALKPKAKAEKAERAREQREAAEQDEARRQAERREQRKRAAEQRAKVHEAANKLATGEPLIEEDN